MAANTGFLGGPAVLANMAVDRWVPNQFSALSSRLVTRNGVLLMGAAALAVLVWTEGYVALLVVLYTVNVFITFALSFRAPGSRRPGSRSTVALPITTPRPWGG